MAKCYKLYGYPPGYKPKQTPTDNAVVHQMKENVETPLASNGVSIAAAKKNVVSLLQTLSTEQCQHLMAVLSSHLVSSVVTNDAPSTSCTTGICSSVSVQPSLTSMHWIMDSGASTRICSNAKLFLSMRPIQSCAVILPNKIIIPVHFSGDIQLAKDLVLRDVLYIPEFHFNLISVSALTTDTDLTLIFSSRHFTIQNHSSKMFGKGDQLAAPYCPGCKNFRWILGYLFSLCSFCTCQ